MADAMWFVGVRGERKGPFSEDDIKEMVKRGEVGPRDVVWKEGMESWAPIFQTEPFVKVAKTVPMPPPSPPSGPNPFAEGLKSFGTNLCDVLIHHDAGLAKAVARKPVFFSLIWILLGIGTYALLLMQARIQAGRVAPIAWVLGNKEGGGGTIFLKGLLFGLILFGLAYSLLMLIVGILRSKGSQADWADGLSILGFSSVPLVLWGLLLFAFLWIEPFLFNVLAPLALVLNILFFARVFEVTTQAKKRPSICVGIIYWATWVFYSLLMLLFK
jgi:hypothetical protein